MQRLILSPIVQRLVLGFFIGNWHNLLQTPDNRHNVCSVYKILWHTDPTKTWRCQTRVFLVYAKISANRLFFWSEPAWVLCRSGLGNWIDVAEHVGTKTKAKCESHFLNIYLKSVSTPLPVSSGTSPKLKTAIQMCPFVCSSFHSLRVDKKK